ncbi:MAG: hypothetical protein Q8N23_19235 [Archangium sp.]|nr:hypothetical protein [Archangium sp.]MDP3154821.1 hypothetical protein [Archangium sp.]MDP3575043.1 hypothetical protein [Archangium sp.]
MRSFVVASTFLVLLLGCSTTPAPCGPEMCSGCCDSNGICQAGDVIDGCGTGGLACNVCVAAVGQVCSNMTCVIPEQDAGTRLGVEVGTGDHTASSVTLTQIAVAAAGLNKPTDLGFNPLRPDELWVVNAGDDSVLIITNASASSRTSERRKDGYAVHFMSTPSSIAFGGSPTTFGRQGTFATCQESRNSYGGAAAPNDFMGPSLWSSDLTIFAKLNPNGLGSHLDMLHASPLCMGIAHEANNSYWAFGGLSNAILKYDFGVDDGIGNDEHGDGEAYQYITGQLKYAPGIPSHLAFRQADQSLFIADTGNGRIVKMDTTTGTRGPRLQSFEPMAAHYRMENAVAADVVSKLSALVEAPSGLELKNDLLYVSDNGNSRISVFTLSGERVNYLDTGLPPGSLAGMAFGPDEKLYIVDMVGNRVLRIDPP